MRNPVSFEWIKYLAKNMDAKASLGAVLIIGIVMIGLFGGAGGLLLATFLVTPLTILIVGIFQDRNNAKADRTSSKAVRRAKPKLVADNAAAKT